MTAIPKTADDREQRLEALERALCRPLPPGERASLRREYLNLTDRKEPA